ncbi:MAG: hypothetical protein JSW11_00335 [Candidatus Heimdallarchaeota archaeon]|nr:MAG: hypothetical protein JSW11_00335 [Candidatus Heimdallarchaeota archaeon]
MDDKKIKVYCRLTARGTDGIEEAIDNDLNIPDPDDGVGKTIIEAKMKDSDDNSWSCDG